MYHRRIESYIFYWIHIISNRPIPISYMCIIMMDPKYLNYVICGMVWYGMVSIRIISSTQGINRGTSPCTCSLSTSKTKVKRKKLKIDRQCSPIIIEKSCGNYSSNHISIRYEIIASQ